MPSSGAQGSAGPALIVDDHDVPPYSVLRKNFTTSTFTYIYKYPTIPGKTFDTANTSLSRPYSADIMLKRPSEQDLDNDGRCSKRFRPRARDRLSSLSDELILRTFSFLPVSQLVVCERCAHSVFSARRLADHEDFLIG